jgi:hypothetical protein
MDNGFWESEEIPSEEEIEQENESSEEMSEGEGLSYNDAADAAAEAFQTEEEALEDDSEILTNARLRLEQGKLYEMLLKHDLFGEVEADPKAIQNVQREIRNFIKERLEVLLGLKPDPRLKPVVQVHQVQSPFSDLEVDLLKRFLAKMSKGATEQVQAPRAAQAPTPVSAPRSSGINPLSQKSSSPSRVRVAPPKQKVVEPPSQVKAPSELKKILEEEFGENEMPLQKAPSKMKRSELMERNRRIAQRQAARKATGPTKIPAPNPDQETMMMMNHVMQRNESLQQGGMSTLKLAIAKSLQSNGNEE